MSCCKILIKNTGNSFANFNYQRCFDAQWVYEDFLLPGETKLIYALRDTFSSQYRNVEILSIECDRILPTRTPTRTAPVTPSITPSMTSTPPVTPTRTIPVTPSNTPTSSPFINGSCSFVFQFGNFGNNLIRFTIGGTSLFKMTIDWGDGTSTFYDGLSTYFPSHNYINSLGIYNVNVSINGVTYITSLDFSYDANSVYNSLTEVFISQLTSLEYLNLSNNELSYVPYPLPQSILYLFLGHNKITNFSSSAQPLPPSLYVLDLQYNLISNFTTTVPLPVGLTDLLLNDNPFITFSQSQNLPETLETFSIAGCSLSSFELINTINFINNTTYLNGQSLNMSNQTTGGCVNILSPEWIQLSLQFPNSIADSC